MQQYFDIDNGSGILTIFHTKHKVSFNIEHYGGFSIPDDTLVEFLKGDEEKLGVSTNPAEEHPDRAQKRPLLYPDTTQYKGELYKVSDGLEVYIDGNQREVTTTLTLEQSQVIEESIAVGSVERYSNGQYPVEFVSREGVRDRAEHTE